MSHKPKTLPARSIWSGTTEHDYVPERLDMSADGTGIATRIGAPNHPAGCESSLCEHGLVESRMAKHY